MRPLQFKIKLAKHYWNMASTDNEQPENEWSFQPSDGHFFVTDITCYSKF